MPPASSRSMWPRLLRPSASDMWKPQKKIEINVGSLRTGWFIMVYLCWSPGKSIVQWVDFFREHLKKKPSNFPWFLWDFPVICPLNQSIDGRNTWHVDTCGGCSGGFYGDFMVVSWWFYGTYPLVNVCKTMERSTIFNEKTHTNSTAIFNSEL